MPHRSVTTAIIARRGKIASRFVGLQMHMLRRRFLELKRAWTRVPSRPV